MSIVDQQYTSRLANGFDDGLAVEWSQSHQVHNFHFDALLSSLVRSLEHTLEHTTIGHYSYILTDTLDVSLPNRQDKVR